MISPNAHKILYTFKVLICLFMMNTYSQNYDESLVPEYELPDILISNEGSKMSQAEDWESDRRPQILALFAEKVYGYTPSNSLMISKEIEEVPFEVTGIQGIQKQISITFTNEELALSQTLHVLLILPLLNQVPVFVGINGYGNHTVHSNTHIRISDNYVGNNAEFNIFDHKAGESSRGVHSLRWPIERILSRGYGLATFHGGDLFPDRPTGASESIKRLWPNDYSSKKGTEWNALGVWAWGLSRVLDHLLTEPRVDTNKIIAIGHSRRGKAALWAGAQDERFAAVISNNSGCGGAALSKREFGERVKNINDRFPHWFCDNFKEYNDNEGTLPLDQHMLLSLIAPRLLYVASAEEDQWADPKGEYLATVHASKAYALYGLSSWTSEQLPPMNQPLHTEKIGYHIRSGGHDLSRFDWEKYMDFMDTQLR